ncbi:retrovirus-related pol polyprotein from transposon RE1 [Citrus sinensis]|nr:retrovirus-related pol polyprotein from transposon RE1 [Citrus sinensis]
MVSEPAMSTSNITSSSFIKEPSLNIQSFHQCSSLVSIKLDNTNFLLWRSQVLPLVRSLGILHHITDAERPAKEILLSDGEKAGNEDFTMWINNDGLLTSWLLSLMTEEVMSGIVGVENAQQIWSSLEDQLLPMTKEKEVHLMDRLATLKKGSLSVEEYVRKYKHICDFLAAINKPVNDLDKVFGLARGLGYRYQDFKLAQLSKPPYPSFKQFVMALENHEQTLINFEEEKKNTINLAQAFFSQRGKGKGRGNGGFFNSKGRGFTAAGGQNLANSSGQKINYNGGKSWNNNASQPWQKSNNNPSQQGQQSWQGNWGQQWQQPRQNNSGQPWHKIQNQSKQQAEEVKEETVICQICHLPKHTTIECRRRYDYSHLTEEIPQALAAMNLDANDAKLYADSGATTHMVNDPGKISELKPYEGNDAIIVGNGDCLNISHIGNTSIDTGISKLYLKNVLVVPSLKKNLLSVGQLTHDNSCIIEFSSNKFVVKDYQGNILAKGTKTKGLYALDEGHHAALYLSEGRKAPYNIWHQRMGHPQIKSIKFLNKNKLIDVSNWITKDYVCSSCQMGKNCKLPFNFSNKISSVPLHKIHCDLWGPAPISSVQNFRYYVVFVDDCTRYTWLYPLKNKSDLFDVFIKFQKQVENRFDKRIKIFQSDGGGEFISNEFQSHLSQCGIQHQLSCPATPEQNGVAERKHRHIVETEGLEALGADVFHIYVSQEIVTFPDVESWTKKEKATNKPYHTHRCHDILSLDENSSPFQQAQHEFHVNQQQVAHANPNSIGFQNTMNSNMHDLDTSQQVPREIHDIVIHTDSASTDNQASLSPSSASLEEFDITSTEQESENNIGTGNTHLELETNTPQSTKGIDIFVDLRIPKEPETSNTHQMITRHKLRHHPELVDKMALTTTIEPKHFKTAIRQPHWRTAMLEELDALHQNNTWSLVPRPVNTNIVGSKWVYRTKFKEDGSIDKYKARLVAQGYTQIPVVTGNNTFLIDQLIHQLSIEFALKDLGQLHFFLGLEIRYFSGGIYVSQTKYTKDLLTKAKMLESTSLSTPMAIKEQANPIDHKPVNAIEYRRLVGGLQYLTLTRPDIVHAVNKPTVSRSSAEAEYRALASTAAELTWITYLYREIGIPLAQPPQLLSDNLSALHMTINPVFHARSKHIELDYHFIREKVVDGALVTKFVPSSLQIADVFTKALSKAMFRDFRYKLGVHQMSLASLRGDVKQADQDYQKESHQRSSQQRVYHSTQLAHVKAICQGISPARFLHLNANIM